MADWVPVDQGLGIQPIATTSTVKNHPLGKRIKAKHATYGEAEFVYLLGLADTAVGTWVHFRADNGATVLAVANGVGPLAVSMSANVASQYGWYAIYGKVPAKVLASFADNGDIYLTSTAGSVDDSDVAGDYVTGALGASAIDTPSTGLAEMELWYPCTHDGKDD